MSMNILDSLLSSNEGDDNNGKIEILRKALCDRYQFRYNSVRNRIEYASKKEEVPVYIDLTDTNVNTIMFELKSCKVEVNQLTLRQLLNSDFVPSYNPITHYFDSLPSWDNQTDFIAILAGHVETTNNELWRLFLRKWLIGTVACAYNEDLINESILIFKGKQNAGKTRFFRSIIPKLLVNYYSEERINFKDRNSLFALSENFIINLDEFENIMTSTPEEMKSALSSKRKRLRRPYAALSQDFPRRASFAATINNGVFLKDTTGNRRYLVADVLSITLPKDSLIDNVFSQAFSLYEADEPHYFTNDETELINEHNKQFEMIHPEFEAIQMFLRPRNENDTRYSSLTTTQIAKYLSGKTKLQITPRMIQKIGIALIALNFKPRKSNGVQHYDLVMLENNF